MVILCIAGSVSLTHALFGVPHAALILPALWAAAGFSLTLDVSYWGSGGWV